METVTLQFRTKTEPTHVSIYGVLVATLTCYSTKDLLPILSPLK